MLNTRRKDYSCWTRSAAGSATPRHFNARGGNGCVSQFVTHFVITGGHYGSCYSSWRDDYGAPAEINRVCLATVREQPAARSCDQVVHRLTTPLSELITAEIEFYLATVQLSLVVWLEDPKCFCSVWSGLASNLPLFLIYKVNLDRLVLFTDAFRFELIDFHGTDSKFKSIRRLFGSKICLF